MQEVGREFGEIGDVDAAVAAVRFPEALGLEVLAEGRGHDFAGEELLDEFAVGALRGTRRRRCVGVLAVHARDALPECRELLLDVLHSLFLCPI